MSAEALVAMVDFLYYGEANVNQENLDTFLSLAEELRLKGLIGSSTDTNHEEFRNKSIKPGRGVEETRSSYDAKTESFLAALVSVEADQLED